MRSHDRHLIDFIRWSRSGSLSRSVALPAYRMLRNASSANAVRWIKATDPVALSAIAVKVLRPGLSRRQASNHILCRGCRPIMVSQRSGGALSFYIEPDDPDIHDCLAPLRHYLER
jgi:hypothetical protein